MATSYNGWPASSDRSSIGVTNFFPVSDVQFPAGVKSGDVAVVMGYLVKALHTRVEPIMTDPGCWGHYYRANVNNPDSISCHGSGTAIDYNAPKHPNGVSGTWSAAQYAEITKILNELENVVRMLKGYDEMHFEIRGTYADVKRVADKIRTNTLGNLDNTGDDMAWSDADKNYLAQKLNESESQIMGAVRLELDELRLTITGGRRVRDAAGNVIDPDPVNISNADAFTKIEVAQKALDAKLNQILAKLG